MTLLNPSQAHPDEAVRRYLKAMAREMHGRIPPEAQDAYLGETEFWLEKQANDYALRGTPLAEATVMALKRHGAAKKVARTLCEQWFETELDTPIIRRVGRANTIAATIFGMGNLVSILFLQLLVLMPSETARLPFNPAPLRKILPEGLPLPEFTWQFLAPVCVSFLAPVVLGAWVGALIPVRAPAAVYRTMCPIIGSAFLLGCLLLPNPSGLLYALFQTIFWLPMGCFMAHVSSHRARNRRARNQKDGSAAGPRTPGPNQLGATQ